MKTSLSNGRDIMMRNVLLLLLAVVSVVSLPPLLWAGQKPGTRFTGEISGDVPGSGKIAGPLTITIEGEKVTGLFSGTSSTGDSFRGTITGTCDAQCKTLKATYVGSFDRVLGGKSLGAVSMNGTFEGTKEGARMKGTWGGRAKGSWNAAAVDALAAAPAGEAAGKAVSADTKTKLEKFEKLKKENNVPSGTNLDALLALCLKEAKRLNEEIETRMAAMASAKDTADEKGAAELKELREKHKRMSDLLVMTADIMMSHQQQMISTIRMFGR